jgi:hypothetical protein
MQAAFPCYKPTITGPNFAKFHNLFTSCRKNTFGSIIYTATFAKKKPMFWTLELASYLEEAPWPATKDELIDYSIRSGAPLDVVENLQELEDEGEVYESIDDIWPDYPSNEDFMFNEDEY